MVKLYKIIFKHYSPKDSKTGICTYVIANDDEQVMRLVDSKYCYDAWQEREDDFNESSLAGYAEESPLQRILRYKGECNDPDLEPQDCYYGATYYGWEAVNRGILDTHAFELTCDRMVSIGICEDWRIMNHE